MNLSIFIICLLVSLSCQFLSIKDAYAKNLTDNNNKHSNGIDNVGIIGGYIAKPGMFPFIVSFQTSKNNSDDSGHFCGGALISDKFIVSAAHCFVGIEKFYVLIGAHNFENKNEPRQRFNISKVTIHPRFEFAFDVVIDDIALVELSESVDFKILNGGYGSTSKVDIIHDEIPFNTKVTSAGWGATVVGMKEASQILKYGDYKVLQTRTDCASVYAVKRGLPFLCIETGMASNSPYYGDSGGPLIVVDEQTKKVELIGVTSFVANKIPTKNKWKNVIFTKLSYHLNWIESIAGTL